MDKIQFGKGTSSVNSAKNEFKWKYVQEKALARPLLLGFLTPALFLLKLGWGFNLGLKPGLSRKQFLQGAVLVAGDPERIAFDDMFEVEFLHFLFSLGLEPGFQNPDFFFSKLAFAIQEFEFNNFF